MTDETQSEPVMAGSGDASNSDKLAGLIKQVDHDHAGEGAEDKADHVRDRMDETKVEPEEPSNLHE